MQDKVPLLKNFIAVFYYDMKRCYLKSTVLVGLIRVGTKSK